MSFWESIGLSTVGFARVSVVLSADVDAVASSGGTMLSLVIVIAGVCDMCMSMSVLQLRLCTIRHKCRRHKCRSTSRATRVWHTTRQTCVDTLSRKVVAVFGKSDAFGAS